MRSRFPTLLGVAVLALAVGLSTSGVASALDSEQAYASAQQKITAASNGIGSIQAAILKGRADERTLQARIADAVLLMGSKDYGRASNVLNEVIEKAQEEAERIVARAQEQAAFLIDERGLTQAAMVESQRIIAEHGGVLRVKTEPGAGSIFTVTLPVDRGNHHV